MTMTDPIADMLTRIRNANTAYHETVLVPASTIKIEIAKILEKEGYIKGFEVSESASREVISIRMKYGGSKERAIMGLKRISKPGLRVYAKIDEVPRVLGGLGIAILSTSKGLLTDSIARKERIGGEVLCFVW